MINETLNTPSKLQMALIVAEVYLAALEKDTPYQNFDLRWKNLNSHIFFADPFLNLNWTPNYLTDLRSGDLRKDGEVLQKEQKKQ